ncbi:flagellar motor switch protein FliM [Rhizobium sp. Root274]|uniref:FliM/FliN family flagellar motor switch protein n=1 Tax=unclassified Rhizobium TaxID=2613769 RepID=UPI0007124AFA|nr:MULTISPECIES: FliM/FliN family flagellar motor switch protein [unclassified Rhizobium]KQW31747.1 flagellar motor switch protein FliM [Rhizobium sp. Root1240]KRD33288.1 flagellar motor switch protein FliM [Rhizobium sp. Root274]
MIMSDAGTQTPPQMDRALLAMLTGGLGDAKTLQKLCTEFGQLYSEFLPDVFHSETGLSMLVHYNGHESGLMTDLLADLGDNVAFSDGQLRNWSPNFVLACGNSFIITLMENLLGALPETIQEPIERPLSQIELDLSTMVFDKIANVLRSGVNAAGGFEPLLEKAHNAEDRAKPEEDHVDEYAVTIKLGITLGPVTSEFYLVIPQKALLKTVVTMPKSKNQAGRSRKEWQEQIAEQVRRSQVTLEARVRLESLTLSTVSRLVAGDVIAFRDKGDVMVDVSANGKDLYRCEFGRAGDRYTVRVKDNVSSEDEILRHLMS